MNVEYSDGRAELLRRLNADQVAEHIRRVVQDPFFESAAVWPETHQYQGGGTQPPNRHERRRDAAEERRRR